MKKESKEIILLAVAISLAAHTMLVISSNFFVLPGMQRIREKTRALFRIDKVEQEPEAVRLLGDIEPEVPAIKMSRQDLEIDKTGLEKMLLEEKIKKDISLKDKKAELREEAIDEEFFEKEKPLPEDIVDAEAEKAMEDAAPEERILAHLMGEGPVDASQRRAKVLKSMDYKMDDKGFKWTHVLIDTSETVGEGVFQPGEAEFAGIGEGAGTSGHQDISSFLEIKVYKYADPATGEKYFKLVIRTREGINFKIIPKEVIFLIDSSKSITPDKLSYIKAAIDGSLAHMNPDDRFNVVAFRGDLIKFKNSPVKVSRRNIEEAKAFIGKLEAVGQTDVDNALLGIVDTPLDFSPSYIVLVTDGRPTTGITDSRRIIQQITRANDMKRPIFSFGGGQRVNRYLLDFISYQNRGWSRFADRTHHIEDEFETLYQQIKDPLLLNVRYRLINLDPVEVYPKDLPDFYKGSEFTMYGRFEDEDVFSMQLLGEMNGKTRELIFRRSLAEAEEGAPEVARQWAFRKIYYLISRDTTGAGDHRNLLRQIDDLSEKYDIITPYDIEQKD